MRMATCPMTWDAGSARHAGAVGRSDGPGDDDDDDKDDEDDDEEEEEGEDDEDVDDDDHDERSLPTVSWLPRFVVAPEVARVVLRMEHLVALHDPGVRCIKELLEAGALSPVAFHPSHYLIQDAM
jgi:hypothetical protein